MSYTYYCHYCEENFESETELSGDVFTCEECDKKTVPDMFQDADIESKAQAKETIEEGLKKQLLTLLILKKRDEVTERIVKEITSKEYIYTIRSDEKLEMWIYYEGIYIPSAQTFIKEHCRRLLGEVCSTNLINQVISKIEIDNYIESKEFFNNINPDKIIVENGILNLKTKTLEAYDPKQIFFSKIPVTYDPQIKTEEILKHFKEVLKSEEDIPVIQELIGLCLFKKPLAKAFLFVGTGRNGKSITEELIKRFLGVENCTSLTLQELDQKQYSLGELHNKLANLGADISNAPLKETASFKSVTGADMLGADRKFLTKLYFTNYAKMIFSCNEIPKTYDISFAFFNRWLILEFPYTFVTEKELDKKNSKHKLVDLEIINKITTEEELSGLLNWGLEGLDRYLINKDFSYSKSTKDVKEMWIRKSNSFQAFIMDHIEESFEGRITKDEMRRAYSLYCRDHKIISESDKMIKRILVDFGAWETRWQIIGKQIYYWKGVKFKSQDSQDSDGFYTYTKKDKIPKSVNTPTNQTNLTYENEVIEEDI